MAMPGLIFKVKCHCTKPEEYDEVIAWYPKTFKCVKTVCLKCHKLVRITSGHCSSYLKRKE